MEEQIPPSPATPVRTAKQPTPTTQAVELKSEKGVDYLRLQDLLKMGEWKAADQETADQILKAMGKDSWWQIESKDLLNFPCADLKTLDQLWVKYSNGKWGFNVQKQIYVACGAKLDGKYPGNEIWREFCCRVGWRKGGSYLNYSDLTFNLKNSSAGECPTVCGVKGLLEGGLGRDGKGFLLFSRIQTCKL
ncbi:GUN4 domain-containing protein [Leptolyngbya iicbica]|uniref:GUN4 domain-containing protein n=1 Tax=Lyngbya confervoides BDU141951 TaxID=1574623 RepID=A0A8T6QWH2_9CYAN|nr:GUN4 domain-containing protein [Leptolyngbya sp. LK]